MAKLRTADLTERIALVIEEKYPIHSGDFANAMVLGDVVPHPPEVGLRFPVVGVYCDGRPEVMDSPQVSGSDQEVWFNVETLVELLRWTKQNSRQMTDTVDGIRSTIQEEHQLLHPTLGTKLAWVWRAYWMTEDYEWYDYDTEGGLVYCRSRIKVDVHEAEDY